jgi:hypothetical protein
MLFHSNLLSSTINPRKISITMPIKMHMLKEQCQRVDGEFIGIVLVSFLCSKLCYFVPFLCQGNT